MITAQVNKIASALGVGDKFAEHLNDFLGMSIAHLAAMAPDMRLSIIQVEFRELRDLRYIDNTSEGATRPEGGWRNISPDVLEHAIESLILAISSTSDEVREKHILAHAKKMPQVAVRKIANILDRLPVVGLVLECAPHPSLMITKSALAEKKVHFDDVHEVHGMPQLATWKSSHVQTVIINAINMFALSYAFIEFAHSLVRFDQSVFVVLVHNSDVILNFDLAVATAQLGNNIALSIIAGSQKKIIGISDVIKLDA